MCVEVRELTVLRDGRRAPRGTASRNLYYPCCFRDGSEIRARSHIYDPGRLHGQPGTAARLLPLSVDGLILAASLVLLRGALISAWPAVAFIGAVEMVMQLVRRARGPLRAAAVPAVPAVPGDVEQAVRAAYAASVAAGAPLSQRAMASRFGVSRRKVSQLTTPTAAHPNGDTPAGQAPA